MIGQTTAKPPVTWIAGPCGDGPAPLHKMNTHSLTLLSRWAASCESDWSSIPGKPGYGCYGTGYDAWGVQTQQKYLGALAVLSAYGSALPQFSSSWALERALAALRFNLDSHKCGSWHCTDGAKWGHSWISALGVERMMHGVQLLAPHFTSRDSEMLRDVLCSEANWLLNDYRRADSIGIAAGQWGHGGKNAPESNIWNGALLWRASAMYPDEARAADWQEQAHRFLVNGVSVPDDAQSTEIVAGKPVRDRYVGANFFPHYALDHHGYMNVGYMMICVSNAAMLHFDMKSAGLPRPGSLDHGQAALWAVLRNMIFEDGRLARIGGDTRIRYAYCQEYMLPSLLYAAEQLGDSSALALVGPQLDLIQREADYSGDGSFYSRRLAELRSQNPLYYTRIESDRACALGMLVAYSELLAPEAPAPRPQPETYSWSEPEHGSAMHRSATRFASFAWRAFNVAQGLCQPPEDGHLAEWEHNLAGIVEFSHHPTPVNGQRKSHRRVGNYHVDTFPGGFVTCGSIIEGTDLVLAESWSGTDSATHQIAFAALPDDHTVVALQFCRMGDRRGYIAAVKGLHLNVPNDLYNDHHRHLKTAQGDLLLTSPAAREELVSLHSRWAGVEDRVGVIGLYGADTLTIHRNAERNAGNLRSIYAETICFPGAIGPFKVEAGEIILDAGWAVLSSANAAQTEAFHVTHQSTRLEVGNEDVRAVRVTATDEKTYVLIANFGMAAVAIPAETVCGGSETGVDVVSGQTGALELGPGHARLLHLTG